MTETLRSWRNVIVRQGTKRNSVEFLRLLELCRPIEDIGEKAELSARREEMYRQ